MDDFQIIPSSDNREEKGSNLKIFLIIFVLVIVSIGIAGFSYFLGTKFSEEPQATENQVSPTQTSGLTLPENTQTSTPLVTKKPLPTPKVSPTLTPKPSPTSKMSSTPSLTPTPAPILKSKILPSIADLDGFRSSNGGGNSALEIRAGRNSALVSRGFVSFEISEVPSNAEIQSAVVRLYQTKIIGNPYNAGGLLKLDHLTYGDALDSTDYALPALSTNFVTLSDSKTLGWKEANVIERLKDDIANARSTSQFRVHFQTEVTGGDATGDFVYFEAQDNSMETKNTPQLVVKYYSD